MTDLLADLKRLTWLEPWEPLEPSHAVGLEQELQKELSPGHVLHGRNVRAVAARGDCDDVLYVVDSPPRLAVVHLTWTGRPPEHPPWPSTSVLLTLDDFVTEVMRPSHDEWSR